MSLGFRDRCLAEICRIIKERFPNLTTMETITLSLEIIAAVEKEGLQLNAIS